MKVMILVVYNNIRNYDNYNDIIDIIKNDKYFKIKITIRLKSALIEVHGGVISSSLGNYDRPNNQPTDQRTCGECTDNKTYNLL